ncbi:MAG: response regulator [Betaproteobacteria bacterium]|nr:MAG: response regulator [Betaproteobacteria bacterium]
MSMEERIQIRDLDVYAVTDKGDEELKRGSTTLSQAALELLVLLDGKSSFAEIGEKSRVLSAEEIRRTAQQLAQEEYIKPATLEQELKIDFSYFFANDPVAEPSAEATAHASGEVESGTAALKLNGYYVSIARKAAKKIEPSSGASYTVLVVEDDPELQRALKFLLTMEKFVPRLAANREQILEALRLPPLPDVALLDVGLPDTNGFDVLARMRQHPQLKAIPVIMLTGMVRREDVMRGLAAGADGYITKPFDRDVLLTGIRSVLGLG